LLRFSTGHKVLNDTYVFNPASTANKSRSHLFQALITDAWKLSDRTSLTIGTQFINKKINSNDRGLHNLSQAAAFAAVNQQLGTKVFIAPAVRLDWNEQSGLELVPQINLSYSVHPVMFRASAGKTIRDADFTERYNNFNKPLVTSGRIGNPQLEPERSFSYELGADYFASNSIKVSATFFQRFHNNLIDYANTPYDQMPRRDNLVPGGNYALAKNIAEVNITGADAALQVNKKLNGTDEVWATVGFTWLHSTSSDAVPSLYIYSHAKYLTNFNLQYIKRLFTFTVNGLYKQRQPQLSSANIAKVSKDYFLLNAKAEAFLIPQNLSVFVEADNLFNTPYADLLGAEMPGRWLMGGIKISLSK
jgi:iron complex outermembrane receptor protein